MVAMFNKNEGGANTSGEAETIIGKSVKIEGDFNGEGNIIVEGEVQGNLKTNQDLDVKQGAKITADTEATNMKVAGEIQGNVKCHGTLEITSTGKILGDIETDVLSVAAGAGIKGQVTADGSSAVNQESISEPSAEQE